MTSTPTATDIATEIHSQMSADDIAAYAAEAWRSGVSDMLQGEWEGADLDDVMAAITELAEVSR